MKHSELSKFLDIALPARRRVLLKGIPGGGKSEAFRAAAARCGMDFIPICAPLQSPVKVGGYPRPPAVEGGDATHCLFDGVAAAFRAVKPTVMLWDDLGMANGETLKAILDLVQFGRIDGRTLPDCVTVAGATNDIGHGADVQGLIEPMKSRWQTIIELEIDAEEIVQYGLLNGWPAWLCAYIRNSGELIEELKAWRPSKGITIATATPRGIDYLAGWDNLGVDDREVWSGCVGPGQAVSMLQFKKLQADLPDVDSVLIDPDGAPVPENPGAKWLISMALASHMTCNNFAACLKYLERLPAMFKAFGIKDAFQIQKGRRAGWAGNPPKGWKPIESSRDFTAFVCSEEGKTITGMCTP